MYDNNIRSFYSINHMFQYLKFKIRDCFDNIFVRLWAYRIRNYENETNLKQYLWEVLMHIIYLFHGSHFGKK